jgi:hypothetical protein
MFFSFCPHTFATHFVRLLCAIYVSGLLGSAPFPVSLLLLVPCIHTAHTETMIMAMMMNIKLHAWNEPGILGPNGTTVPVWEFNSKAAARLQAASYYFLPCSKYMACLHLMRLLCPFCLRLSGLTPFRRYPSP